MSAVLFEHTFRTDLFVRAVGLTCSISGSAFCVFAGVPRRSGGAGAAADPNVGNSDCSAELTQISSGH